MKKRIIWSDLNINFDDWRESYKEFIEINELDEDPDNEYKLAQYISDTLVQYLGDERLNLNILTEGPIIAIADLGLWNGRVQGYKIFGSSTVNDIFKVSEDYNEYYSDGRDIRATCVHHDGTNHILYRVLRKNRNPDQLLYNLYHGKEITRKQLNYYTKSLHPYVAKVYGW